MGRIGYYGIKKTLQHPEGEHAYFPGRAGAQRVRPGTKARRSRQAKALARLFDKMPLRELTTREMKEINTLQKRLGKQFLSGGKETLC